jgi:hypothetical protein
MVYSVAQERLIPEINLKAKISCQTPFNLLSEVHMVGMEAFSLYNQWKFTWWYCLLYVVS